MDRQTDRQIIEIIVMMADGYIDDIKIIVMIDG